MQLSKKQQQLPKTDMNNFTSVIAAVSTPPGKGGVAIIRVCGEGAIELASRIFTPIQKKSLSDIPERYQVYGTISLNGEQIDDGMATCFRSPRSYTGEETVEISCHGGVLVTSAVLEALLSVGARLADPGEFTRRAFVNGKLSLTEAEAIGNLLEAESREQLKLLSSKSREIFKSSVEEVRKTLTSTLSSIYARIDYPDEDLGDFTNEETSDMLSRALAKIDALISTYRTGRSINEGVKTVICGKPNAGKSSIYNILLGTDAAIVTDIEGTTRDVLRERISLGRVLLSLADTAGVREGELDDKIEMIGIERSYAEIDKAELVLTVFDLSRPFDALDSALIQRLEKTSSAKVAILNKNDLPVLFDKSKLSGFDAVIEMSTKDSSVAKEKISSTVNSLFTDERIVVGSDAIVSSARHNAALSLAREHVSGAIGAIACGLSQDMVSSDIERALAIIAELDGASVSDEVVADIFSKFCVGK